MIANARMYAVTPAVAALWKQLFEGVARKSGAALDIVDHPPPKPIADLWQRSDKAAVFMCGLPFSLAEPRPALVAAPVPEHGKATYWTDLVVAADSPFRRIEDTLGKRIAFTTTESQSGFAAPLHFLMGMARDEPLYDEVVAPAITPVGAVLAVAEGRAEVAPLDSYALALMRRYAPDLAARVRTIASTKRTAIPPLVASDQANEPIVAALLSAHINKDLAPILADLLLLRFERPDVAGYDALRRDFGATTEFWRHHRFCRSAHPVFAALQAEPAGAKEE